MQYNDFYKGIVKSEFVQTGFYRMENVDVHSKLGVLQCSFAMETIGSATVNEPSILVMDNSGNLWMLSKSSGKIWKKTSGGTFSLARTNTNGAHSGGGVFNNRLWYMTWYHLGYHDFVSTWNDTYGYFGVYDTNKPFLRTGVNRAYAYIGNRSQIASINVSNVFNANALDIPVDEIVTDIAEWGNDIVISAYMSSSKPTSKIYRWNQYGDTYYKPDLVPEQFISALFESTRSNILFALCANGLLMNYTGAVLEQLKEMRDVTPSINPYNKTIFQGRSYFAIGANIYSLHRADASLPFALTHEYTASGTIASLESDGTTIYASHAGGVDKLSTNRATAVIETPVYAYTAIQRALSFVGLKPNKIKVDYYRMPSGCSITAEVAVNGGDFVPVDMVDEPENNRFVSKTHFPFKNVNCVQARITLNPSGSSTPEVLNIEVF